jgi:hypothetical protein
MTLIPELQQDLVDAAARMSGHRQRVRLWLRLTPAVAVAAAIVSATVLLLDRDESEPASSSPKPAGLPQGSQRHTPPEGSPPRLYSRPLPGSLSQTLRFEFAGVRYSTVGYRSRSHSRDGQICTRLTQLRDGLGRRVTSDGCAGERLLRRELDDHPARTVGGGGEPIALFGFARADVTKIAVLDRQYPSRVVLSEPWSPEPWRGEPIRFFRVLIDAPRDRARDLMLRNRPRLVAGLTSGEWVDVVP